MLRSFIQTLLSFYAPNGLCYIRIQETTLEDYLFRLFCSQYAPSSAVLGYKIPVSIQSPHKVVELEPVDRSSHRTMCGGLAFTVS
jgi:hypothetical protein